MKSSLFLGTVAALVVLAPAAVAKSPAEVEQIAQAVSVEMLTGVGSGVIIHRQRDLYSVITNRHVVCRRQGLCIDRQQLHTSFKLKTADGRVHQVPKSAIKLLKDNEGLPLDLAIVQFRSNQNYAVTQVAEPGSLKVDDAVYTAGFPKDQGWLFGSGTAQAVVNRRLAEDKGGYTVVYNAETFPGMSGGGAFDQQGRLVAVHGRGDRYTENTEAEVNQPNIKQAKVGSKIGYNRGIPVRWVVQSLEQQGILLGGSKPPKQVSTASRAEVATADEFFIVGFNKLIDPGEDFQAGRKEALLLFDRAVSLNPRYTMAYFMRAIIKDQLQDYPGAIADYNQVISLKPKSANVYYNRGLLKMQNLQDYPGALADFNQAISLNPKLAEAYANRGSLKADSLQDYPGALADYNQAITVNPQLTVAYYNRGNLKMQNLNDYPGALADFNRAISLDPKYAEAYNNRGNLKMQNLNDYPGALADYNQAISLNPRDAIAYSNRGVLKATQLDDRPGGIADLRIAAKLFRESGNTQLLQVVVEALRQLGATE